MRSILPHFDQVSNLMVPVALSASTIVLNSARMEPTWSVLCESAGIMASACLLQGKDLPAVDYTADVYPHLAALSAGINF